MPTAISVVTLLTDFGDRDPFVASMKGVILGINPQARIVDLSHQIAPQQIEDAAYVLKSAYRYFPDGSIHVVVVDPGVGSSRRPLLVTTSRYFFLAPDNGLLTDLYQEELSVEVRQLENRQYRLDSEGSTFEGRDVFAPAAAWLTRGQAPGSFGRLVRDVVRLPRQEPGWQKQTFVGRIAYVDRFGNLISNMTPLHLKEVQGVSKRSHITIRLAGITIEGLTACYADGHPGAPHALINSNGELEIFVKEGSAADVIKAGRGERIELS
ncbi:MAG: SAM hydrolase/SAM-dependent halogenase family protein [Nitrospiraceae bacterium]